LDSVLQELDSGVQAQDYFLSSPLSSSSEYRDDHVELREALQFTRVLVQMAVPPDEKDECSLQGTNDVGRWQFLPGLRQAIGIKTVVTPEARQRDSSSFSLPSEEAETPMTSNLSFCNSTLTTNYHSNSKGEDGPPLPKKTADQNGLELRQAIQEFTTVLQSMSRACCSLDASQMSGIDLARLMDHIKKLYVDHLLVMKQNDLKSLVDSFEFVLDNPDDSYELKDEDDGDDADHHSLGETGIDRSADYHYPIVHALTIGSGNMDNFSGRSSIVGNGNSNDVSFNTNLSSLQPSIVEEEEQEDDDASLFEFDDLRRQTGSSDERDGSRGSGRDDAPRDPPEVIHYNGGGRFAI